MNLQTGILNTRGKKAGGESFDDKKFAKVTLALIGKKVVTILRGKIYKEI